MSAVDRLRSQLFGIGIPMEQTAGLTSEALQNLLTEQATTLATRVSIQSHIIAAQRSVISFQDIAILQHRQTINAKNQLILALRNYITDQTATINDHAATIFSLRAGIDNLRHKMVMGAFILTAVYIAVSIGQYMNRSGCSFMIETAQGHKGQELPIRLLKST